MKFTNLSTALAAALVVTLAHAKITIQDDFVDESALTQLLGKFPVKVGKHFRQFVDVPQSLYDRMVGLVAPAHERKALAAAAATTTAVQLPARREYKSFSEHKDVYADMSTVEQKIGLLYLKGDGVMRFTHDETGEETHVDVKPGRFLTWDNSVYTHIVFPGQEMREMVGPVAFKGASPRMVSTVGGSVSAFQAYADRLVVTPGSLLRIHAELILQEWPGEGGKGGPTDEVNIFCTTLTPNRRALNAQGSNAETKFRKASIFPNTYKPKLKATVENGGDTMNFELTKDRTIIEKLYKFTWVVKIGTDVSSGDELDFAVDSDFGVSEDITVVVK